MQLLKQLQPGLHVPNVAESVLQTSVSAVILVAIVDRKTDTPAVQRRGRNRPTTRSKQANVWYHTGGCVAVSLTWLGLGGVCSLVSGGR